MIEYVCPHCGKIVLLDVDDVNLDEKSLCPFCGELLFPLLNEN